MQCSIARTVPCTASTSARSVRPQAVTALPVGVSRRSIRVRAAEEDRALEALRGDEDLEAQLEQFMKEQAAVESGLEEVLENPEEVIGAEEVDDATARDYCMKIVEALKKLQQNRDMNINEVKLTIAIEDPRSRENRRMGVENRIVNRDEMASALVDVATGQIPKDRMALAALWEEMTSWPFLDEDSTEAIQRARNRASMYAQASEMPDPREGMAADAFASSSSDGSDASMPLAGPATGGSSLTDVIQPPEEAEKSTFMGQMPEWVGFVPVYAVSLIPAGILFFWVSLLWTTSFKY